MKKWGIFGFADDEGVGNTGGRRGAAAGPESFLQAWKKINGRTDLNVGLEILPFVNPEGKSLAEKHHISISQIQKHQPQLDFTIAVGGGHDYIYCHLKGIQQAYPQARIGCINIDPHMDMRDPKPVINSGSPFRLAIEQSVIAGTDLVEFGIQPHANAAPLWKFAAEQSVSIVDFDTAVADEKQFEQHLRRLCKTCDLVVISLDMDCFAAPFAPGVSAPAPEGFTPTQVRRMLQLAAAEPAVCSLGIYELNPVFDQDMRTAKLAAFMAWYFAEAKFQRM